MLRHRVTVITLCPLGEPEIAIGLEPRIEPWLPRNRIACQVSRAGGRCHYSKMNRGNGRAIQRKTSRAIESHLQTVGWISRQKISRLPAEGEAFLLTSPFIELAISFRDSWCEGDFSTSISAWSHLRTQVLAVTAASRVPPRLPRGWGRVFQFLDVALLTERFDASSASPSDRPTVTSDTMKPRAPERTLRSQETSR